MNHSGDNHGRGRGSGARGGGRGRGSWRGRGGYHPYQRGQHGGKNFPRGGRGGGSGSQPLVVHGPLPASEVKRTTQTTLYDVPSPFHGWKVFFPEEVFSESSAVVKNIRLFQEYIRRSNTFPSSASIEEKGFFSIDFKELIANSEISHQLTDLADQLKHSPEMVINCLSLAGHEKVVEELQRENGSYKSEYDFCPSKIHCRIINYEPLTPLKLLKANYYGKFVSVRGTVVRVSSIKPLCIQMAYECTSCAMIQVARWPDGKCAAPPRCSGDCRGRTFNPKRSHRSTHTVDCQTIRVQEIVNDDEQREAGRIPRTVDCEMTFDLVDRCVPGDMVTVSGIVKVMNSSDGKHLLNKSKELFDLESLKQLEKLKEFQVLIKREEDDFDDDGHSRQRDQCVFLLYISANSLTNAKGDNKMTSANSADKMSGVAMEFTMKELYAIQEIHSQPNLFQLLVASICPAIYGHELVKAGLVLGLFGGSHKYVNDKNRIPVRGDPHILIVGDPGLGKSQMLQSIASIAPRSVYVCANTTTTSGLTVTLCKDGGSGGDHALEAGALVLADQGCCCIDEFDKMGNQHQALLEAMEQQTISIAKAGIVCSLPARTSIIAAANPVGGHYNKAKTVAENLRMGSALLSRFDLVFILLDKPDEDMDSMLSEHVISLHAGMNRSVASTPSSRRSTLSQQSTVHEDALKLSWEADKPLSERLKVSRNEFLDFIPAQLLRKYIAYARKYVHPKIGKEAADVLQNFYLDLRRKHHTQDSTPITTRQLESLIRLTEARTRLELREESTEEDAKQVVEIMKYSMIDTYSDDFGRLDFKRSQHGSGSSTRSQARRFIAVLQRLAETTGNSIFNWQELKQVVKDANIQVRDFETFIASLNDQGFLLKKGPKIYQLLTMA